MNAPTSPFQAETRYNPARPGVLVVYCSDGRITEAVEELLRNRVGQEAMDRLCVPGGPVVLTYSAFTYSERDAASRAVDFLITRHNIRRVLLIGHENCVYYQEKLAKRTELMETQQLADLKAGRDHIRRRKDSVAVEAWFARHKDGRLVFEEIAE